jgi:hypothetical protein
MLIVTAFITSAFLSFLYIKKSVDIAIVPAESLASGKPPRIAGQQLTH